MNEESASNPIDTIRHDLASYKYVDYLRALPKVQSVPGTRAPLRVAVLRSCTVEPIEPVLKLRLLLDGYQPEIFFGDFNQYAQEILDPSSRLRAFRPDLILLMVRVEELVPEFVDDYASKAEAEWLPIVESGAKEIGTLAQRAAAEMKARVLVQSFALSAHPYLGVYDAQRAQGQAQLVHEMNRTLAVFAESPGVYVWDFNGFLGRHGREQVLDSKGWYTARSPYRQTAYPALVDDLMRHVRPMLGRLRKCLVVDLDNTLWGGVLGEDGFDGIQLGDTYPGNCYKELQRRLLRLHHRGIILAINSKNNEDEALRVLNEHPDMVLRPQHFAAKRINWRDKASNMRELAEELNLGIDSFVFIDDNPAECDLVRQHCPGVGVVMVPSQPYLVPDVVFSLPEVENIRLTDEDRRKGELYGAQAARRAFEASFAATDLEEFVRNLRMEVEILPADSFSIPRVAQLTQKTNQMNVTTRRYSETQIEAMSSGPATEVYSVSAKDRFGDHGIIGVLILEHEGESSRIDTFLLSCRVIGRGIEKTVLDFACERVRARGASSLVGEFIPTAKNAPAADLFQNHGFEKMDGGRFVRTVAPSMSAAK